MNDEPTPTNGRPFYCQTCGAGFGEFIACEEPDCQLETVQQAENRMSKVKIPAGEGFSWPERRVVRVDPSPMNPKIKVAQLSCGHDVYRNRRPRIGATIVCDKCAKVTE